LWSKANTGESEIQKLERAFISKLPRQLIALLTAQNGNDSLGFDNIASIISHLEVVGDVFLVLEFIPIKKRNDTQYDCLDSASGCIVRVNPSQNVDARTFPVVAPNLSDYIKKCMKNPQQLPTVSDITLGQVSSIACCLCNLLNVEENEFREEKC